MVAVGFHTLYYGAERRGMKPSARINAFRGERLKSVIEEVFTATVKLLYEKGYVKLEKYFVDGTKIESAANKYRYNFGSQIALPR